MRVSTSSVLLIPSPPLLFHFCNLFQPTSSSTQRHLAIDIPVAMIPPRLWEDYQEPKMPDIDVSIYLPSLRSLKTNVDRMKNLAPQLVGLSR